MQAPKFLFHFTSLVLVAVEDQYLDSLIHWELENGDILFLSFHFHMIARALE